MALVNSALDAKEYLAGRIAAQAEREGTPLPEVERKMLWFSETGATLPDMKAVSEEFDRTCNQNEYEQKIATLVRHLQDAGQSDSDEEKWDAAVSILSEGDHYLVVLIANAAEPASDEARPRGDRGKLILAGVLAGVLALPLILLCTRIENPVAARWAMMGGMVAIVAGVALLFNARF